ncbi:MAG: hypothetical protein V4671_02275 [Armatimonadota bacterium]
MTKNARIAELRTALSVLAHREKKLTEELQDTRQAALLLQERLRRYQVVCASAYQEPDKDNPDD